MNRLAIYISCACLSIFCFAAKNTFAQDNAYVSYDDFYQELAPYGQWIDAPQYGYVWSPDVDGDFRPYYTSGHWVMTEYGNTWVSDYPWGWACFHYGRWTYDSYYGWLWIPGSDWGPAWVSWRYGDGFYGWSPLAPGYTDFATDYSCPDDWWVFIPPQYLYAGNYYRYWYGPRGNSKLVGSTNRINTTFVNNNVTYICGPRAADVQQITHQPVQVYHLASSNSRTARVHNNTVKMYRPTQVRSSAPAGGQRVAPPNVVTAPQAIRKAEPVNNGQGATPQFREEITRSNRQTSAPGTGFNETAEPAKPQPRNDNNSYEWNVNKTQQQPARQEAAPQPVPVPPPPAPRNYTPQQPRVQPQPQNNYRPQPQPQRAEPVRQAPAPQPQRAEPVRQAPAPQPAQQTRGESSGRR